MAESAENPTKRIKATVWVYMKNNGDGSASPCFFNSEDAAEKYAENDDERYCEDIDRHTLEFDENGNLLTPNPVHYAEEEDDSEG
jgi:hypothetical protein